MAFIDITGQIFGKLTVIKREENDKYGRARWLCECSCPEHNKIITLGTSLRAGVTKSCGCINKEQIRQLGINSAKKLTNQRFGKVIALYPTEKRQYEQIIWHCRCDCGNECEISSYDLTSGRKNSCTLCDFKSQGELKIISLLKENSISYEKEKWFDSCRFKDTNALVKFDFYINNQYIIEYDGIQHFQIDTTEHGWNTKEAFLKRQEHDKFKNQWCKNNNIPLIRIPYIQLKNLCIEDLLLETSKFLIK